MTRTQAQKILGQGGILVCLKDSTPDEWWQARELVIQDSHKVEKIEQIVNEWNNDASNSFGDMCKINKILKE